MAPRNAPRTIVHPLFLLEHAWEQWLSHPFIAACERRGVRPNAVTGVAFGLKLAAAPFMAFRSELKICSIPEELRQLPACTFVRVLDPHLMLPSSAASPPPEP